MIGFFDGNIPGARKFADALHRRIHDMTIVCPTTTRTAVAAADGDALIRPWVPPGWASRFSRATMPYLRRTLEKRAARRGHPLDVLFLTIPHYVVLARQTRGRIPSYYYCVDDYLGYEGWPVETTRAHEHELCTLTTASIFVSEALRERAIANYGIPRERTFVSPNATEGRFAEPAAAAPRQIASLAGPVFGVVGMLTSRIDYDFLLKLADGISGSLVLVGAFDAAVENSLPVQRLRAHPRVHCFGWQPHDTIHAWMAGFDVGVIPFRESEFNRLCSPIRLFDHLAIGQPILATGGCDQLKNYDQVVVAKGRPLAESLRIVTERCKSPRVPQVETWDDRVAAFLSHPIGAPLMRGLVAP